MPTTLSNTLLFSVGKIKESFAVQKILTFFQQKRQCICKIYVQNFNETLRYVQVNFEQPAPGLQIVVRTSAALPLLEPPVVLVVSRGLRTGPVQLV